jgi:hypothetical protein
LRVWSQRTCYDERKKITIISLKVFLSLIRDFDFWQLTQDSRLSTLDFKKRTIFCVFPAWLQLGRLVWLFHLQRPEGLLWT